ncbi:hypothetical protein GcC1_081026 [Golovinomyces cichoracearum]|uniref:Uncharacterized protein n=1 Tax=Golovinomyces cichoracearum TaxID=62708 RepID=A0A420IKE1_9PEZI|nr:hypothetical protein GcC1_081026 [Golovinomyces cichoracearum]
MRYTFSIDTDSSSENSNDSSSNIEFHEVSEFPVSNPFINTGEERRIHTSVTVVMSGAPEDKQEIYDSEELSDVMSGLNYEQIQGSAKSENLLRIASAIENVPPEVQRHLLEILEGVGI